MRLVDHVALRQTVAEAAEPLVAAVLADQQQPHHRRGRHPGRAHIIAGFMKKVFRLVREKILEARVGNLGDPRRRGSHRQRHQVVRRKQRPEIGQQLPRKLLQPGGRSVWGLGRTNRAGLRRGLRLGRRGLGRRRLSRGQATSRQQQPAPSLHISEHTTSEKPPGGSIYFAPPGPGSRTRTLARGSTQLAAFGRPRRCCRPFFKGNSRAGSAAQPGGGGPAGVC